MKVQLRGQEDPVNLVEVEEDSPKCVIGTTGSGKRFVALRDRLRGDLPIRHPYRVYLRGGGGFRAVDPSFEDAEKWLLNGDGELDFTLDDGREVEVERKHVLSLLSATPEDEANTIAQSN